jgi:hypothetical protein
VPRPSWVLTSFTVSRRAAVALAREDAAGKAGGTFQAEASISRRDAGPGRSPRAGVKVQSPD